jgi:hypothetical protein
MVSRPSLAAFRIQYQPSRVGRWMVQVMLHLQLVKLEGVLDS